MSLLINQKFQNNNFCIKTYKGFKQYRLTNEKPVVIPRLLKMISLVWIGSLSEINFWNLSTVVLMTSVAPKFTRIRTLTVCLKHVKLTIVKL